MSRKVNNDMPIAIQVLEVIWWIAMLVALVIIANDIFTVEDEDINYDKRTWRMKIAAFSFCTGIFAKASKYIAQLFS